MLPGRSVPRRQGYDVVQAPLLERKVSPAGVGSLTTEFGAMPGPLLVTMTVKSTKLFGLASPRPVLVTLRSATEVAEIGVAAVELLFPVLASGDEVLTVAVLLMVVPEKLGGTLYVAVMITDCPAVSVPR